MSIDNLPGSKVCGVQLRNVLCLNLINFINYCNFLVQMETITTIFPPSIHVITADVQNLERIIMLSTVGAKPEVPTGKLVNQF